MKFLFKKSEKHIDVKKKYKEEMARVEDNTGAFMDLCMSESCISHLNGNANKETRK